MKRVYDLTGQRIGALTCQSYRRMGRSTMWTCLCDCGKLVEKERSNLLASGVNASCGCIKRVFNFKHGQTVGQNPTREYQCWAAMKRRCNNPNCHDFDDYGGRGIKVCDRWNSFENFFADMGKRPDGMTLDRKDVNGNYEPDNCRWATIIEQANNKRNTQPRS